MIYAAIGLWFDYLNGHRLRLSVIVGEDDGLVGLHSLFAEILCLGDYDVARNIIGVLESPEGDLGLSQLVYDDLAYVYVGGKRRVKLETRHCRRHQGHLPVPSYTLTRLPHFFDAGMVNKYARGGVCGHDQDLSTLLQVLVEAI